MSRVIRAALFALAIAAAPGALFAVPSRAAAPGRSSAPVRAAAPARTPAAPATRPAAAPAARAQDTLRRVKTIEALLAQADEALEAEDFKVARDALYDVLQLDSKNPRALAGVGYASLRLGQWPRAQESLENAIRYGEPLSKPVVLSIASALLRAKNPMRAVKHLRDFLGQRPDAPDEEALNAIATCLSQADNISRNNAFFKDSVKFYEVQNAKLEQTRPGEKRWGTEWLPAAEAEQKLNKMKAEEAKLALVDKRRAQAQSRFNAAKNAWESAQRRRNKIGSHKINFAALENEARAADAALTQVLKEYQAQWERVPRPVFPSEVAVVPMDLVPDVALASAGSTGGPGKGPGDVTPPVSPGPGAPSTPATPTAGDVRRPAEVAVVPTYTPPPAAPGPRRPRTTQYAAAFPVAPDLLVTSAAAVEGATLIRIQGPDGFPFEASVIETDDAAGLALLRPKGNKRFAYLAVADTFAGGPVQCVSFPTVNLFDPAAEAFPGSAPNPAGAAPGQEKWAVKLSRHPRLGGSPLVANGKVVGVQLATRDAEAGAVPAATLEDLKRLLGGKAPPHAGTADPRAVTMQLMAVREKT